MSKKIEDDSTVLSVRVSAKMKAEINRIANSKGLSAGVYVRTLLYEKFGDVAA